ncbi:hypothetical protein EDB84DRAFT_1446468 [Lactarius hengduanensis]|nr:hypothetical protein EDB84DRAFT_1446468 [Lactarius hengduanensis]
MGNLLRIHGGTVKRGSKGVLDTRGGRCNGDGALRAKMHEARERARLRTGAGSVCEGVSTAVHGTRGGRAREESVWEEVLLLHKWCDRPLGLEPSNTAQILRPSGKPRSLTHIAVVDGFEANPANLRGFRIGIDASIWFFHAAHGRGGENPELCTLSSVVPNLQAHHSSLSSSSMVPTPQGQAWKSVSGGKHWLVDSMKRMIEAFGFEWRMAPGEAEAELAYLNSIGIIDAVLSDDVDNFLFGARIVIRKCALANTPMQIPLILLNLAQVPTSQEQQAHHKNADGRVDGNHSMVYTSAEILAHPSIQLTRGGLILIGLLSGGDYHPGGLTGCGTGIAHGLAKCGFGDELLKATQSLTRDKLPDFLTTWRKDLRGELRTNSHGHLGSKKPSLAKAVPDTFPDINILLSYTNPIISATDTGTHHTHTLPQWEHEPDLGKLAHLSSFSVLYDALHWKCPHSSTWWEGERTASGRVWDPIKVAGTALLVYGLWCAQLRRGWRCQWGGLQELIVKVHSLRMHAYTDSILEYRLEIAPAQLVHLACAGIQGLQKPADTTYDVLPLRIRRRSGGDLDDDGDTGQKKKEAWHMLPTRTRQPLTHVDASMYGPPCTPGSRSAASAAACISMQRQHRKRGRFPAHVAFEPLEYPREEDSHVYSVTTKEELLDWLKNDDQTYRDSLMPLDTRIRVRGCVLGLLGFKAPSLVYK